MTLAYAHMKKIEKVNEKLNWTNISLKALSIHSSSHFAHKEKVESLKLFMNIVNKNLSEFQFFVSTLKHKIE